MLTRKTSTHPTILRQINNAILDNDQTTLEALYPKNELLPKELVSVLKTALQTSTPEIVSYIINSTPDPAIGSTRPSIHSYFTFDELLDLISNVRDKRTGALISGNISGTLQANVPRHAVFFLKFIQKFSDTLRQTSIVESLESSKSAPKRLTPAAFHDSIEKFYEACGLQNYTEVERIYNEVYSNLSNAIDTAENRDEAEEIRRNTMSLLLDGACLAVYNNDIKMLTLLKKLDQKGYRLPYGSPYHPVYRWTTPLQIACALGCFETAEYLIREWEALPPIQDNSHPMGFERSRLAFLAASGGHLNILQLLEREGVSLNVAHNITAAPVYLLWLGCMNGDINLIQYLAQKGPHTPMMPNQTVIPEDDINKIGACIAAENNQVEVLNFFYKNGVDLKTPFDNKTSLHGNILVCPENFLDKTPFLIACAYRQAKACEFLAKNVLQLLKPQDFTQDLLESAMDAVALEVQKEEKEIVNLERGSHKKAQFLETLCDMVQFLVNNGLRRTAAEELFFRLKIRPALYTPTEKLIVYSVQTHATLLKDLMSGFKVLPPDCQFFHKVNDHQKKSISAHEFRSFLYEIMDTTSSRFLLSPDLLTCLHHAYDDILESYSAEGLPGKRALLSKEECEILLTIVNDIFLINFDITETLHSVKNTLSSFQNVQSTLELQWKKPTNLTIEEVQSTSMDNNNNNFDTSMIFDFNGKKELAAKEKTSSSSSINSQKPTGTNN